MKGRGHRWRRRAWLFPCAAALFMLLPGPGAADEIQPDVCTATSYTFYARGAYVDSCTYNWDVDPPYDGTYYTSESEAIADESQQGTVQVTVTLPTWRNLYDWPAGHGYAGVHPASSSASLYGMESNLGGNHGLWLWPRGGQYGPGYAEWTYTAPGTTRIAKADLSYAYRNKLLAHHCVRSGLRTNGTTGSVFGHCKPIAPPDSQRDVTTTLSDPAQNPTSKEFFFRIEFPQCNDPSSPSCTKNIPMLDPLATGGYARLKRLDMTLVDDDKPTITADGPLYDAQGVPMRGEQPLDVTLVAHDAGAGVRRLWLDRQGAGTIAAADAACDEAHTTPALDNRLCPADLELSTTVDLRQLAEGTHTFVAHAVDVAGNASDPFSWSILIDRTPPAGPPTDLYEVVFDPPAALADALARAAAESATPFDLTTFLPGDSGTLRLTYRVPRNHPPVAIIDDYPEMMDGLLDDLAASGQEPLLARMYTVKRFAAANNLINTMVVARAPTMHALTIRGATVRKLQRPARRVGSTGSQCPEPWWPARGRMDVFPSAKTFNGQRLRYVYQLFTFTESRIQNIQCDSDATLEMDAVFYNGGSFEHYLRINGIMGTATNLPDGYIDTQVDDNLRRPTWTIGTSDTDQLVAGRGYYTMIRSLPGPASGERAVAQAQIGDIPGWCPHFAAQLCIFANASEILMDTDPNRTFEMIVPGRRSWVH